MSKSSNSVPLEQLTESEIVFLQRYPTLDKFYKAFGPDSWRYALEHVDKAVNTVVPSLNRLNLIYNTKDADVALFVKHFLGYYLMVERSGKELGKDVCTNVAAIFLGRNGAECTPVKLLCYFANYPEFKDTFREFDLKTSLSSITRSSRIGGAVRWLSMATPQKTQTDDKQPCGLAALKLHVREWIEQGEDPRQHLLYKAFHTITDEMITEAEREIALGVF